MSDLDQDLRAALRTEGDRAPDADLVVASLLSAVDEAIGASEETTDGADGGGASVVPLHRHRRTRLVAGWGVAAALVLSVGVALPTVFGRSSNEGMVSSSAGAGAADPAVDASGDPEVAAGGAHSGIADLSPAREAFGTPVALPAVTGSSRQQPSVPATLALERGCLVAKLGPTTPVVLWEPGTTAVLEDGLVVVHDRSGRRIAAVGDRLRLRGGPFRAGESTTGTPGCRIDTATPVVAVAD